MRHGAPRRAGTCTGSGARACHRPAAGVSFTGQRSAATTASLPLLEIDEDLHRSAEHGSHARCHRHGKCAQNATRKALLKSGASHPRQQLSAEQGQEDNATATIQ